MNPSRFKLIHYPMLTTLMPTSGTLCQPMPGLPMKGGLAPNCKGT